MGGDVCQWNGGNIAGPSRGVRGGEWGGHSYGLSSSCRYSDSPTYVSYLIGFPGRKCS